MVIRIEQQMDGRWLVYDGRVAFGIGTSRHAALVRARSVRPDAMCCVPLQPEEIPGELREIARRMRAVGDAVLTHEVYQPYHPTAEAMGRWADSVAEWAGNLEGCAKPEFFRHDRLFDAEKDEAMAVPG